RWRTAGRRRTRTPCRGVARRRCDGRRRYGPTGRAPPSRGRGSRPGPRPAGSLIESPPEWYRGGRRALTPKSGRSAVREWSGVYGRLLSSSRPNGGLMARKLAQSTLEKYRTRLEEERQRLTELIDEAAQALEQARQTEASAERSPDPGNAEAGSMKFEYEKELSMQQNAIDLLHKVEHA